MPQGFLNYKTYMPAAQAPPHIKAMDCSALIGSWAFCDMRKSLTQVRLFQEREKFGLKNVLPRMEFIHTSKCLREYLAACGGCQV